MLSVEVQQLAQDRGRQEFADDRDGPYMAKLGIFREKLAERLAGRAVKADEILFRLWQVGRLGIAEFFTLNAERMGPAVDWEAESPDRDLPQKIRIGADGAATIEGGDWLRALELLGKAYGMLAERVINEQARQPVSDAALEDAMERVRAFEAETAPLGKDWRRRVAAAAGRRARRSSRTIQVLDPQAAAVVQRLAAAQLLRTALAGGIDRRRARSVTMPDTLCSPPCAGLST